MFDVNKAGLAFLVAGMVSSAGIAQAQTMTEFGAVAAGSVVGGAAGRAVTGGLANVLGKVANQTAEAASTENGSTLEVDPATAKTTNLETVAKPLHAAGKQVALRPADSSVSDAPVFASLWQLPAPPDVITAIPSLADVIPNPAPLPPPEMTTASFKKVAEGMSRTDLLRMGAPAFKVTMDEDGHLVEIYSYHEAGTKIGTVRLTDGAVASIRQ